MNDRSASPARRAHGLRLLAFWTMVGIPLAWGVTATLRKAMALFA